MVFLGVALPELLSVASSPTYESKKIISSIFTTLLRLLLDLHCFLIFRIVKTNFVNAITNVSVQAKIRFKFNAVFSKTGVDKQIIKWYTMYEHKYIICISINCRFTYWIVFTNISFTNKDSVYTMIV